MIVMADGMSDTAWRARHDIGPMINKTNLLHVLHVRALSSAMLAGYAARNDCS